MIYFCKMLQIKPRRHAYPLIENSYSREYTPKEINQQKQKMIFMKKLRHKTAGAV